MTTVDGALLLAILVAAVWLFTSLALRRNAATVWLLGDWFVAGAGLALMIVFFVAYFRGSPRPSATSGPIAQADSTFPSEVSDILKKLQKQQNLSETEAVRLQRWLSKYMPPAADRVPLANISFVQAVPYQALVKVLHDQPISDQERVRILEWISVPGDGAEVSAAAIEIVRAALHGVRLNDEDKDTLVHALEKLTPEVVPEPEAAPAAPAPAPEPPAPTADPSA